VDGKESTPARPHGDAGTKSATAADGPETEDTEGPAAPADNPSSTTRDQAGAPPSPATGEGQPSPSTPADPVVPPPPAPAPASAPASPPPAEPTAPGPPPYGAARPADPKIFDLPDHDTGRRGNGADRPLVLGGAAAAEGRTSGSHPRIAGPATPPGGDGAAAEDEDESRGRHFAAAGAALTDRWPLLVAAVPALVLALLIGSWAIDTAALSGQVMRNVQVAGRDVGGLGEASLPDVMDEIDDELAARPVVVTSDDRRYETTAGEIGLTVDTEATAQAALDAGRGDSLLTRPFAWLGSFFGERDVDVQYSVKESQVVAKMLELQGPELLAPHDPTIQLGEAGWVAVPGVPGQGVDTDEIVAELPAAAGGGASGGGGDGDDASGSDDDGDAGEDEDPIHV
jgi:Putative peptidoglycan binding domain